MASSVPLAPQRRTPRHAQTRRRQKNEPRPPQAPLATVIVPTVVIPKKTAATLLSPEQKDKVKAFAERTSRTEALLQRPQTQAKDIFHVVAQDGAKIPIVSLPISKATNTFEISDSDEDDSDSDSDDDDEDEEDEDDEDNENAMLLMQIHQKFVDDEKENLPFDRRQATQVINNILGRSNNSGTSNKFSTPFNFSDANNTNEGRSGMPADAEVASLKKHKKGKKNEIFAVSPPLEAIEAAESASRHDTASSTTGSSESNSNSNDLEDEQLLNGPEFLHDKKKRRMANPGNPMAQDPNDDDDKEPRARTTSEILVARAAHGKNNGSMSKRQAANAGKETSKKSLNVMAPEFIPPGVVYGSSGGKSNAANGPVRINSPLPNDRKKILVKIPTDNELAAESREREKELEKEKKKEK
ncbi:hypothetical protein BC936DRAFT_143589, partial [Jimgerdemannia flammicorona]